MRIPVVLVTRTELGTLNHSLLSLEALERRRIHLLGVIVNGQPHPANEASLQSIGKVQILGRIPTLEKVDASAIKGLWSGSGLSKYW